MGGKENKKEGGEESRDHQESSLSWSLCPANHPVTLVLLKVQKWHKAAEEILQCSWVKMYEEPAHEES